MAIKKCKRGSTTKLSKNFTATEFDCEGTGCCNETVIDEKLVEILQKIRDHFGKPVTINSGYRTVTYNKKVDGAIQSQHLYGMAADISVSGVKPKDVAAFAETLLPKTGGIGIYDTFTHVDVRAAMSRWKG